MDTEKMWTIDLHALFPLAIDPQTEVTIKSNGHDDLGQARFIRRKTSVIEVIHTDPAKSQFQFWIDPVNKKAWMEPQPMPLPDMEQMFLRGLYDAVYQIAFLVRSNQI